MGALERLARLFLPQPEDYQLTLPVTGNEEIDIEISRRRRAIPARSWRIASVEDALGVPSVLSAVTLIADTVGSLSLEAFKNGRIIRDALDIPRVVQRPLPGRKPFDFFRDTVFHLATRGEFWWWIAHRDSDGMADALFPIPPREIRVESNRRDRLRPRIYWLDEEMPNEDIRHHMYMPDATGLRGLGPLQLAGAAVSVATEADAWAANFFSGALPSIVGKTPLDLDEKELKLLDQQWLEKDNNLPRWLTNDVELQEPPYNAEKAQLTDTRNFQVGEISRIFNMPADLLNYQVGGTALRYRNDETIWTDFQRRCLSPHYLEPIEQELSDLLVRNTVARFNLTQLLRADPKTRMETYKLGIESRVMSPDEARQAEGWEPGHVDYAPVPLAPASAVSPIPSRLSQVELVEIRCPACKRVAGETLPGHYAQIICKKCGTMARSLDAA